MKKNTKKLGRPPLPAGQKKNRARPLFILCDPAEREAIDNAAAKRGEPASTWARQVLVRAAK